MSAVPHPECDGLGHSPAMAHVFDLAAKVAPGHASVLILGERGTHPAQVAQIIHDASPRTRAPFVRISLPAMTEAYVEMQLFGPASRPSDEPSVGLLAESDTGTLFIEEIGDFSIATQGKLLQAVKGDKPLRHSDGQLNPLDIRLMAATAHDVDALVVEGRLRRDFLDYLSVVTLRIPPLRERRTDIVDLAHSYMKRHARQAGKQVHRIAPAAASALLAHDWPGNVEELDHVIERAVLLAAADSIESDHLPADMVERAGEPGVRDEGLQAMLENVEKTLIIDALETCGGNQAKAAAMLRITERLMGLRVKKYDIDPRRFRTIQ